MTDSMMSMDEVHCDRAVECVEIAEGARGDDRAMSR
jgi:hypothetical protein